MSLDFSYIWKERKEWREGQCQEKKGVRKDNLLVCVVISCKAY